MPEADFKFKEVVEEEERLDYSKLVNCPYCKKPIPHDATMCLYCGETVRLGKKSVWPAIVTISLIIVFIVFFIVYM